MLMALCFLHAALLRKHSFWYVSPFEPHTGTYFLWQWNWQTHLISAPFSRQVPPKRHVPASHTRRSLFFSDKSGQSSALPGPQSTPLRWIELRTAGRTSRTSRQQNQENRHTAAMMEDGERGEEGKGRIKSGMKGQMEEKVGGVCRSRGAQ